MRKLSHVLVIAAASAAVVAGTAIQAQAANPEYAALGDSYASGTGIGDYYDDDCLLSDAAYPSLIAADNGYDLNFAACSGATIPDVRENQLDGLSESTDMVSLSVGGNDAGWVDVIISCARPDPWTCWDDIEEAENYIVNELPGTLDTLYSEVREAAPNANVVVAGYPRLFNETDVCNAIARISPEEQVALNQAADLLADTTADVASSHGFSFADVRDAFVGHAVCDDVEWLNGVSWPVVESYHPNAAGHSEGYRSQVEGLL